MLVVIRCGGCLMRCFSGLALAILSVFLCAAVSAATVELVSGDVLINRGNGFQHVRGTSEVKVGDSVMARPEASARVIYDDTCWVPVKPGHVVVIAPEPPCHKTECSIHTERSPVLSSRGG